MDPEMLSIESLIDSTELKFPNNQYVRAVKDPMAITRVPMTRNNLLRDRRI